MSVYPPPLSQVPIFNPNDFSETVTSVIGGGSTPSGTYLEFPTAQGAETWTENSGNNELVVGAGSISIGYDLLTEAKGIAFSGQGFGYNNGTTTTNTTWSNLQIKVQAVSALAPAQDATTLNVNDAICIQNGESPVGTNTIIISTSAGENQLLLNDSAGTEGYVLTSGGPDGSLSWSAGGGGGSQNLASVLTVGSVADLDQSITLSTTSTAERTNVLTGTGMVVDNVETIGGDTIESKGEISDTFARFSTFNSAQIPSPTLPTYRSVLQADSLVLYDNKYIDPDYITHTLTLEASRIGIDGVFGEIGQVLGKDGDNNPAWITSGGGGGTTLEQAITNGGGVATSSFQIQQVESPNYAEMANDGFVVQNVDNGPLFPPVPTTTTSTLSPASLVLVSAVSGGETKTTTIGVDSVSYRTSTNGYEGEYEEDHMRVWLSGKGSPIYTTIYPNEITLYDDLFAMVGGTLKIGRNKFEIGNDSGSAGQVIGKDVNNDLAWITAGGGGSQSLADVLDVSPAGVANLGQSITIPAGDFAQYLDVNAVHSGDGFNISANETTTPAEIFDFTGMSIQGFWTFRTDTISDPKTDVSTTMNPLLTTITDTTGDLATTATQLTNTMSASSILLKDDSVVALTPTTNSSVEMTNSALTFTALTDTLIIENNKITINGSYGNEGDVLTAGVDGALSWSAPVAPSFASVLSISPMGVADDNQTMTLTNGEDTIVFASNTISINGQVGEEGQLLTSGGAGTLTWGGKLVDYLTTATASSTYQTIADMTNYLTSATASSTYQTIAGMSSYLTSATASATYQTISGLGSALSTISAITIGTNAGSANTITIGNNTLPTANFPLVNIKGKFSINDVLFSGGDGGSPQLGVATYTIPQDALRNSLYTLIIAGTATPTPLNFPTNDTGGKYITIYNAGAQSIRCLCSASPARNFFGGNNGLGGGSEYAIRANQVVQFLSAGSQGFLVFAQSNPNSNQGAYPFPVQSLTTNQKILATRITGASVNGTFSYGSFPFASVPSVVLTAEDATGNHTMTLRTSTTTGFTYVSSTGSFPTALSIIATGTA